MSTIECNEPLAIDERAQQEWHYVFTTVLAALSHRAAREAAGVEKQRLFQSKCHHRPCLRLTDRALTTTTYGFVLLAGHRFALSRNEMVLTRRGPASPRG